jgi:hypothetical protein
MRIRGVEGLTAEQLEAELEAGGRFVFFESCISFGVVTWRRPSDIFFLRARERGLARGLPYTLLTLLLGWWGIPWGLVYTPRALLTNLSGGQDVTDEAQALLRVSSGLAGTASGQDGGC